MMINNVGLGNAKNLSYKPPEKMKSNIKREELDNQYIKDCYKKQSKRDVPMMKGDWGPRLKESYMRWDKDLQVWDKREAGSLHLKRRDIKAKTLAKTYREFAQINADVSLGTMRNIYGYIGLNALRKAIREKGVPPKLRA